MGWQRASGQRVEHTRDERESRRLGGLRRREGHRDVQVVDGSLEHESGNEVVGPRRVPLRGHHRVRTGAR